MKDWDYFRLSMEIPERLKQQLQGLEGETRRKAASLVIDLAFTAGAEEFVEVAHSHVSGVSVITGGHGLRQFLEDLSEDETGKVAIPTTLNSAGCDKSKMEEMDIEWPDFLEQQFEIIHAYDKLGIETSLSCTPYDSGKQLPDGIACWAESNAVCYANSWTNLVTNRESGLSALATALTGFAPKWGLHLEENRVPNILVDVTCELEHLSDWSILGDWIGAQVKSDWNTPWGPMPYIRGLPKNPSMARRKALTAAAANHGCPMLWVEGVSTESPLIELDGELMPVSGAWQGKLEFSQKDLVAEYKHLEPKGQVDLVVIGCPQASLEEIRTTAAACRSFAEMGQKIPDQRLWVFTSSENYDLADADGSVAILEECGAVVLRDTCPEVTPYNRSKYNHLLTNSMKAEHYLTSGLNRIPCSVMPIIRCVEHAFSPELSEGERPVLQPKVKDSMKSNKVPQTGEFSITGQGLESQGDFSVEGYAMVTDVPITYLGYVNRDTGEIEEAGHPLDGRRIKDTILVYPKGSGSTVAPYVLMGLIYTGYGPKAILNRDICPLTLPAASLLNLPYGHGFDDDPCHKINDGDKVRFTKVGENLTVELIERSK